MTRKIEAVGVAVVAVLALSAVIASAASAANFTASTYPTTATAKSVKGNEEFKTEAGTLECAAHFHVGALSAPSPAVTVTPTYSECHSGIGVTTVNMNGCDFQLHTSGEIGIQCPAGKSIVFSWATCEWTIAGQTGLKIVDLSNSGTGIAAQMTVGGIKYTVNKDGFGCPFIGTGAKTGATYTQNNAVLVSSTNGAILDIG